MKIENVLRIQDETYTSYFGSIKPNLITQLTFVPCEVLVPELNEILNIRNDGYQREGDVKRMKEIKRHFSEESDSFIPPVLLSTRGNWTFTARQGTPNFGSIETTDLVAIIDGQHRLGGLSLLSSDEEIDDSKKNRPIPFMAVTINDGSANVEKTEQKWFETINAKQKGIPKSHLHFIQRHDTLPGKIAHALRDADDSVFKGRIGVAKSSDWDIIAFGAAKELVELTLDDNFRANVFRPSENEESEMKALFIVLNYWKSVKESLPEYWSDIEKYPPIGVKKSKEFPGKKNINHRLLEETGLRAFAKIGSLIITKSVTRDGEVIFQKVSEILTKISQDEKVKIVFQKTTPENRARQLQIDPGLLFQGKAGVLPLFNVLNGALIKI